MFIMKPGMASIIVTAGRQLPLNRFTRRKPSLLVIFSLAAFRYIRNDWQTAWRERVFGKVWLDAGPISLAAVAGESHTGYRQSGPVTWQLKKAFYYPVGTMNHQYSGMSNPLIISKLPSRRCGHDDFKIAALVPMRHHSVRVPGKTSSAVGGRPLFHHILQALLDVPQISEVLIPTVQLSWKGLPGSFRVRALSDRNTCAPIPCR